MNAATRLMSSLSWSLVVAAAGLAGCGAEEPLQQPKKQAAASAAPVVVRSAEATSATSDARGTFRVFFTLPEGRTSLQIDLQNVTDDTPVSVVRLVEPSGAVVLSNDELDLARMDSLSLWPTGTQAQLAWPVAPTSEPLPAGTWTLDFGLYTLGGFGVQRTGVDVAVDIASKSDPDTARGVLAVHVVYVDGVDEDPDLAEGVEAALALWQEEVRRSHGLTVRLRTSASDGALAEPWQGNDVFTALSGLAQSYELTMVVGASFDSLSLLGQAGGVPGALVPSARSAIAVAARNAAGRDGVLEGVEVTILSETIAHEVGHYLGLRHVVEGSFASFDPVADTPECSDEDECLALLKKNLMFPFGVSTGQTEVTDGQREVLQHAVAVD
jgi:hypothetical protein